MAIAIIGAAGFAGSFLSRRFRATGAEVVSVKRTTPLPTHHLDVVIDCNGDARRFWADENPSASFAASVTSVAERVVNLSCGRYVYLSSIDVYGALRGDRAAAREDAVIPSAGLDTYGFHKLLAERVVMFHNTAPLVLRLGTLLGPGLRKNPVYDAMNGAPIRQTPDSTLSLVTLDAVADVLEALLPRGATGIFNVTGNASITVEAMLRTVARHRGTEAAEFRYHGDLLHTEYDIAVDKICDIIPIPDSQTMLDQYLAHAE